MKNLWIVVVLLLLNSCTLSTTKVVKLKLIETSDVHGNYFQHNFAINANGEGSLERVAYYVDDLRKSYGNNLLLLDNGDILQGQPSAYYYNYIDTVSTHLCAAVMNYMKYDVGNMGNHDVETGHAVFDRWTASCNFPVLGANILRASDGEPYFKPYEVFEREGVKIAVLGMITPAIPAWLHESLWKDLTFEDMEACARKWVRIIKEKENPDILVGLFHSGKNAHSILNKYRNDASVEVGTNVPGFDILLIGHDHTPYCDKIVNVTGDSVLVINPASSALYVGDIDVTVTLKKGKMIDKQITGKLIDLANTPVSGKFITQFKEQINALHRFVSEQIGVLSKKLETRSAYFGTSPLMDFIHTIQLNVTHADFSLASPLAFDASVPPGDLHVSDIFHLYEYENFLYTMEFTGEEIKAILEESYSIWTNQMKSPDDNLLLLGKREDDRVFFANYYYLFDSVGGLDYTVDVTKPKGKKVAILRMSNGHSFSLTKKYRMAVTSYRGNGGGELLVKGIGADPDKLKDRILSMSRYDVRYYMINYIREHKSISQKPLNNWCFTPETWAKPAAKRDYLYLFGDSAS